MLRFVEVIVGSLLSFFFFSRDFNDMMLLVGVVFLSLCIMIYCSEFSFLFVLSVLLRFVVLVIRRWVVVFLRMKCSFFVCSWNMIGIVVFLVWKSFWKMG